MVLGTGKERPLPLGCEAGRNPEARFESASLHQVLVVQRGWILHWLDDIAANLKPTEDSLRAALASIDAELTRN